jgi:hypothetical protein
MHRCSATKLQTLEARHPGLNQRVYAMFAECWPAAEVKQTIQTQYGERLSLRSLDRYKSKQWQAQRDVVQQIREAAHAGLKPGVTECARSVAAG